MNELPSVSDERIRKARKQHRCSNCGALIGVGDQYTHIKGRWNGEWESFKECSNCAAVIRNFNAIDESLFPEDGPSLCSGGVSGWLKSWIYEDYQGLEAAEDLAKTFGVPLDYMKRQLKL